MALALGHGIPWNRPHNRAVPSRHREACPCGFATCHPQQQAPLLPAEQKGRPMLWQNFLYFKKKKADPTAEGTPMGNLSRCGKGL